MKFKTKENGTKKLPPLDELPSDILVVLLRVSSDGPVDGGRRNTACLKINNSFT